jgi:ADP-heptose:LPS heptosyltransferase
MGIGDQLMAAGEARALHERIGRRVVIVDRHNRPQWSDLWDGLPYILRQHEPGAARLVNAPGTRPYISAKAATRWCWRPYEPQPAEIVFTPEELAFAEKYRGMVLVEPNVKAQAHTNKAWVFRRWEALLEHPLLAGVRFVQCGPRGVQRVHRAAFVETATFREATAVLSVCRAFAGTEGALHHAAAAVGVPAVVLWSEFIDPTVTGYPQHRNLRHAGKACGSRQQCAGCIESMLRISVDEVAANLKDVLT